MTSRKIALLSTCSVQRDVCNEYVTQAMIEIPRTETSLPDVLFPTEGEKSAKCRTAGLCLVLVTPDTSSMLIVIYQLGSE